MSDRVIIFDTTLRDGEQALSASLNPEEKLKIALALEELGVDVMEVGFPISSPGDFSAVNTIAKTVKNSCVCGLARAVDKDIIACAEALKPAENFRIHTFIATSDIHLQTKLHKTFEEVCEMAEHSIKLAKNYTDNVEFSCEDAGRTSVDNLCVIIEKAIAAGATTINIPDTVGYNLPNEFGAKIRGIIERVPNIDKCVLSVHCHNDLGMATANSIVAVENGARQIECAMNGLGERAGNCSLEEVVMVMKTRSDFLHTETGINTRKIYRTSQLVSKICNVPVAQNKAIVGQNAFSHSSGIHQDGFLKNSQTYEIITPESIGLNQSTLHMTSRSGRHVIKSRMESMGYKDGSYDLDKLYARFLKLADKKGQVFDYDLEALLFFSELEKNEDYYKLDYLSVLSGGSVLATASVRMDVGGKKICEAATGNGPVDAVYQCILRITGVDAKIYSFEIKAGGQGKDALGEVDIIVDYEGRKFHGMGLATDIIESSARALVHAINSIECAKIIQEKKEQGELPAGAAAVN